MIFIWETDKERLLRFMRIPARKKLEWLYQINEFIHKFSSKKQEKIRQKLRRIY
jgi:hypothetical protein